MVTTIDGRTDFDKILRVFAHINLYGFAGSPLYLFVQASNPARKPFFDALQDKYEFLFVSYGYMALEKLGQHIHASDAFLAWYPYSKHRYTSSALRLALGCGVPIITNEGGHSQDLVPEFIPKASNDSLDSLENAIVDLLGPTYLHRLNMAMRLSERAKAKIGWSKVVGEVLR
jgi:hypothetical protein